MGSAGRNDESLSWATGQCCARDTTTKRPGDYFEALLLQRVDVLGCDKGSRLQVQVRLTQLATCVACGLAEDDLFSRNRMFEHVT
jgi:hypothetical protein